MTVAPSSEALPTTSCCLESALLPGRGEQGLLFHGRGGVGGQAGVGAGGLERGSKVAAQQGHLPSVPPALLPRPSPLRLRVQHSGDPWELEANFPRSLVMERPQVLPLIKVKCGAEEKHCTQASSSHL